MLVGFKALQELAEDVGGPVPRAWESFIGLPKMLASLRNVSEVRSPFGACRRRWWTGASSLGVLRRLTEDVNEPQEC